jgi:hypothetical protein
MKEEKLILSSKLDETTHKISCDYGSLWLLKSCCCFRLPLPEELESAPSTQCAVVFSAKLFCECVDE